MKSDPFKAVKNRAYLFVEEQQQALDDGRISEAQWFDIYNQFFTTHYLAAGNPRDQSGHDGDEARYRYNRMLILEAIDKDGLFLDVGCANGYLLESLYKWLAGSGLTVEFYGLEIPEGLLQLAQTRLPVWQDRFFLGNALYWTPNRKYDYVYLCGLELAPLGRQQAFLGHLLDDYTASGGRLILGPVTEERASRTLEEQLTAWGHKPSGYCEKSHQNDEELARKLFWFDKR